MCCYSCKRWEDIKIKRSSIDAEQVQDNEIVTIECDNEKIEISGWQHNISSEDLVEAIREDSIGFCNGQIVRAWDRYECFKPKFSGMEVDTDSYEQFETGYLACWAGDGCPFKEKCYGKSDDPSFA